MITGSLNLNNVSTEQVATIIEAQAKHPRLEIHIPAIEYQGIPGVSQLHNGVMLGWDTLDAYQVVADLITQFMASETAQKTA